MIILISAIFFTLSFGLSLLALHRHALRNRLALLIPILFCGFMAIFALSCTALDFVHKSNIILVTLIGTSHVTHLLVITEHRLPPLQKESESEKAQRRTRADIVGAVRMIFNPRYIGTPLEIRRLPRRGKLGNLPYLLRYVLPQHIQHALTHLRYRLSPRFIFVLDRITDVILIHYATLLSAQSLPNIMEKDIHPVKSFLFRQILRRRLAWRDVRLRAILALYVPFTSWARFTAWHSGLAACFVGFGVDAPGDWPSLFGDLKEAYGLRRYWGVFWHGLVYRPYVGFAKIVAAKVLQIPQHRQTLYRLWVAAFVFSFSGLVHVATSKHSGLWCGHWSEFYWSWLNFCAVVAEDIVGWCVERSGCLRRRKGVRRALGYVWVFGFMFWSIPKFQFVQWSWMCRAEHRGG